MTTFEDHLSQLRIVAGNARRFADLPELQTMMVGLMSAGGVSGPAPMSERMLALGDAIDMLADDLERTR